MLHPHIALDHVEIYSYVDHDVGISLCHNEVFCPEGHQVLKRKFLLTTL